MAFVKRKPAFIGIEDIEAGDIIAFERAGGLYYHCGISDGKGNVIHRGAEPGAALYTNSSFAMFRIEIRKDDLRLVAGSSRVYKINMFDKVFTPRPRLDIVRWAEEQIGKKGYNVFFKNCQHFCTKARYNISFNIQVQEHIILKTEQPYEMNRTLVNIVNLPELLRQPVSYKTAEKNVFSLEGYVGNISRHMDLNKLSGKGLCALASSSRVKQQILAAFKNNTHTLFTETEMGNGFERATIKFDLVTSLKQFNPLIKQYGKSKNITTSNCSIIDKGGVIYQAADDRLCTFAFSDTYRLLKESNTAGIREIDAGFFVGTCANMSDRVVGFLNSSTANMAFATFEGQNVYHEVLRSVFFDSTNSTANYFTQERADYSMGGVQFQTIFDDEDMRYRNYMLYTCGMAGGLDPTVKPTVTIFDTVIYFCFSLLLYLILFLFHCVVVYLLIFALLKVCKECKSKVTAEQLFQSLLIILSVVLFIRPIKLCIESDVADIT